MEGYFKLISSAEKHDIKYITKLPATIGRTTTVGSIEGQQVSIGPTEPTLSRYHGIITWNAGKKCFECKCNSKNGKDDWGVLSLFGIWSDSFVFLCMSDSCYQSFESMCYYMLSPYLFITILLPAINPLSLNMPSDVGMVVDRKVYRKHEIAPLTLRSSIRMGSVKIFFVPANSAGTVGKCQYYHLLPLFPSVTGIIHAFFFMVWSCRQFWNWN